MLILRQWGNLDCDERCAFKSLTFFDISQKDTCVFIEVYMFQALFWFLQCCTLKSSSIAHSYFPDHESKAIFPGMPNDPMAAPDFSDSRFIIVFDLACGGGGGAVFWDPGTWVNSTVAYNKPLKVEKEGEYLNPAQINGISGRNTSVNSEKIRRRERDKRCKRFDH